MGKKSPKTPDYKGAAEAEAQANQELTLAQIYANRPTISTDFGNQTWSTSQGVDPSTGKPITNWATKIELPEAERQALQAQQAISRDKSLGAQKMMARVLAELEAPRKGGYIDASQFAVAPPPRRQ